MLQKKVCGSLSGKSLGEGIVWKWQPGSTGGCERRGQGLTLAFMWLPLPASPALPAQGETASSHHLCYCSFGFVGRRQLMIVAASVVLWCPINCRLCIVLLEAL